jgi:exodeoxyribonuclease-5
MIYCPVVNSRQQITGWKLKENLKGDLIIIDEASMVSEKLWQDLTSFGIPIVAVGDHGQLPPIEGNFNLMQSPIIRLEKIHRQAEHNPIIRVSMLARENGYIPPRAYSREVIKLDSQEPESQEQAEMWLKKSDTSSLVLCGYNRTRLKLNQFIRNELGFESQQPLKGDRVICLKNNHQKSVFNGMLGSVLSIKETDEQWYEAEIAMDDEDEVYTGRLYRDQFGSNESAFGQSPALLRGGDFFDFGYALTVHKAQGSQASRVVLFEERFAKMDDETWRRWLYTAVTRAEKELYIVGNKNY